MRLPEKQLFGLPVTFDLPEALQRAKGYVNLKLQVQGKQTACQRPNCDRGGREGEGGGGRGWEGRPVSLCSAARLGVV